MSRNIMFVTWVVGFTHTGTRSDSHYRPALFSIQFTAVFIFTI
jgi:hypothetical protein